MFSKPELEGKFLNQIKGNHEKPSVNTILRSKTECSHPKTDTRPGCHFHHFYLVLSWRF